MIAAADAASISLICEWRDREIEGAHVALVQADALVVKRDWRRFPRRAAAGMWTK